MNEVLAELLETKKVTMHTGEIRPLHSSIDLLEVNFLMLHIERFRLSNSLEIGCAMGVSSLAICEAISGNSNNGLHTIVDPFQKSQWENIGINNLTQAEFSNFRLIEERSEFILPKLTQQGHSIDFAFIDGWHTFDHTLIDFFYINRMLKVGGILVIDDLQLPSVKKAVRFIHTLPAYTFLGSVKAELSNNRRRVETLKSCLKVTSSVLGDRLSKELLHPSVIRSDKTLGLNSTMVAFQKTTNDDRAWDWHKSF